MESMINYSIATPKNNLQTYIADLDILSTLTYKGEWTSKYKQTK